MSNISCGIGFRIRPHRNWPNDPNGLCRFRGRYFFYQYDREPEEVT